MPSTRQVCVFCGSSPGRLPIYAEAAAGVGRALAGRGLGLVYGGGRVGLMGALADAALAAGGRVLGVIPEPLASREIAHDGLTELRVVPGMHERKALMAREADAFLALPGGLGTFEELFEILTWAVLGLHRKPFGLLDTAGYYEPLLAMLDHATREGFIRAEHRALIRVAAEPEALIDAILHAPTPPPEPPLIRPDQA